MHPTLAVDAILAAMHLLVGIALASVDGVEDLTLPQYRALVVVDAQPRLSLRDLAAEAGVHPSTATRLVDRLVSKRLVARRQSTDDRRVVELSLTPRGRAVVEAVAAARRQAVSRVLDQLPGEVVGRLAEDLATFVRAGGVVRSGGAGFPPPATGGCA